MILQVNRGEGPGGTLTLTLRIVALTVILGGCGGEQKPECDTDCADTDTDTDTDTDADTDTDTADIEDCSDGIDNDSDGLLDCEDGDCATDPACVELDCDDGQDSDNDGFTDCDDEDCWGNGCAVVMAKLETASGLRVENRNHETEEYGGPGCNGTSSTYSLMFQNLQPEGFVRTMSVSGTTWNTCDWSAATSNWFAQTSSGAGVGAVSRSGVNIEPGCPNATADLLPQYLSFQYLGQSFDIRTGPNGSGPIWFDFSVYPQQSFSTSTTWSSPGSPCNVRHSDSVYGLTFANVLPGEGYWTRGL